MIRSKLHKVLEAVPHAHMAQDPFFAFDNEATELLCGTPASIASIKALMEHGHVHLPYPQMTVQYERFKDGTEATWLVWFQELPDGSFNADLFACRNSFSGFLSRARLLVDPEVAGCFRVEVTPTKQVYDTAVREHNVNGVADDIGYIMIAGLSLAVLMTHVGGLEREEHEAPEKLNAARVRKGHQPVRSYTYVHVGHFYTSSGEKVSYNRMGRRMPIHMRAGHNRNQFYGKGRELRKLIWIPPVLVNYDGSDKPVVEKRIVL